MRIFKGTETTLKLFLPIGCKATKYEGLQAVLYTADPLNASIINDVRVEDDVLYVTISEDTFSSMEEGVINYIINDKSGVFSIERQSNYFLKTPVGYAALNNVPEPSKEVVFTDNGDYLIKPSEGYNSISEVLVGVKLDIEDIKEQSYNEGYESGYGDGYTEGEQASYSSGYEDGYTTANEEVAETATVLEITENGIYTTDYSKEEDIVIDRPMYGDDFYDYATLVDIVYDTQIIPTIDTKIELWYRGDNVSSDDSWNMVIGSDDKADDNSFNLTYSSINNNKMRARIGKNYLDFDNVEGFWHHFEISKDGVYVDGEFVGSIAVDTMKEQKSLYINACPYRPTLRRANGDFGMIKITNDGVTNIIIPTEDGFKNVTTDEMLPIVTDGGYVFRMSVKQTEVGNLVRTINVNVTPKIDVTKDGVRFAYSTFEEIPSWVYFPLETTKLSFIFEYSKIKVLPILNLPNCIDFENLFASCENLTDLTNLSEWIYPNNANWFGTFSFIKNLKKCPSIRMEGKGNYYQGFPFWGYSDLEYFTDFGGFIGLKYSMDKDYQLPKCPKLSYESCINILNGLYDYTGHNETPTSAQGKLKVHQNFLDLVGDEISIGTNKGWTITV